MLRDRVVPATKALGLTVGGGAALFVSLTRSGGSYSMMLGLAGVLALAGSTLIAVAMYLE